MPYYILETGYYTNEWVWFKRLGAMTALLIVFFVWDFSDMPPYGQFAVYVGFIFLLTALFLSPIDDIAVDQKYFYHIRTSFLPLFSRHTAMKFRSSIPFAVWVFMFPVLPCAK